MPRPRRSVAIICIAAVALAAFLPGVSALDHAVVEPSSILLPDLASLAASDATANEQPQSLLALVSPRAPPSISLS